MQQPWLKQVYLHYFFKSIIFKLRYVLGVFRQCSLTQSRLQYNVNITFLKFIFIYLLMWLYWVLAVTCGISSCSMCYLVPWPGVEPASPALGAWSVSHRGTKEGTQCKNFYLCKETKKFMWLTLSPFLLYYIGLEPNPLYLWSMSVFFNFPLDLFFVSLVI